MRLQFVDDELLGQMMGSQCTTEHAFYMRQILEDAEVVELNDLDDTTWFASVAMAVEAATREEVPSES